jgi:hypothetical protein
MLLGSSHAFCFTELDLNNLLIDTDFTACLSKSSDEVETMFCCSDSYTSSYENYFSIYEISKRTCYRVFGYPIFSDEQRHILLALFYYGYLFVLCFTYLYYFVMMTLPYLGFTRWEGSLHPRFFTLVLVFGIFSVLFAIFLDYLDTVSWLKYIYYAFMELNPNDLPVEQRVFNILLHFFLYLVSFWFLRKYTQHVLHNDQKRRFGKFMMVYIFLDALIYLFILLTNQLPPGVF